MYHVYERAGHAHTRSAKERELAGEKVRCVDEDSRDGRWCRLRAFTRECVRRRSAYTRVNAYRRRTEETCGRRKERAVEVRRGRRAFYRIHMYSCSAYHVHADSQGCIRSRCTRKRTCDGGGAGGEEEDEVERGWMAETVSRANGIVSQCAARRTVCTLVSLCKDSQERRKRERERGRSRRY